MLKALVVEDEFLLAIELEALLRASGCDVVGSAADAAEAVGLARLYRPALTLLDINLRDGLTGPDICRVLTGERLSSVLFVTAQPQLLPEDLAGALGVIEKPYFAGIMRAMLAYVVSAVRSGCLPEPAPAGLRLAPDAAARLCRDQKLP